MCLVQIPAVNIVILFVIYLDHRVCFSTLPSPDDPRRPFPQDIEMRSGHLGRLTSGQEAVVGSKVNDGSTDVSARMQVTGE